MSHCTYRFIPFGWWCSRTPGHDGPCAARPRWWNARRWFTRGVR